LYYISGRAGELPSNGLAFSCRERAIYHLQKSNDLAREAVNCNHLSRRAVTFHQMTGRLLFDPA